MSWSGLDIIHEQMAHICRRYFQIPFLIEDSSTLLFQHVEVWTRPKASYSK